MTKTTTTRAEPTQANLAQAMHTQAASTRAHPGHALRKLSAAAMLVAMACVAAGQAQAQTQTQMPAQPQGLQHAMHHRMGPGMAMDAPMIPERLLDAVGVSAEQRTKLREIFKAAGDDLRAQRAAGRDVQAQMMALMTAPKVDAAAAEALRQKQMAGHDSASKRMLQAMLDAQAVLTPEQRGKLAERMDERRQHMDQRREHMHQRQERRPSDAPMAPKS